LKSHQHFRKSDLNQLNTDGPANVWQYGGHYSPQEAFKVTNVLDSEVSLSNISEN